ncbi:hypothetical protein AMECASPLE_012179 [Ameca splendens]|uniref:Stathmin domain-containing protein 1 n=1 Tax=Ameca splendens TaxID=208324 RepID=A0ABV0ZKR1_9TELE
MTWTSKRGFESKMGCSSSSNTAVHPLTEASLQDEDETGSKPRERGDSAGSKGTKDSGVMMENRDLLVLPGAMPDKLPPLSSESLREHEVDRAAPNDAVSGLLHGDIPVQGRPKSSEILKELWSQGIIPVGQNRSKDSGAAYCIMDESRGVIRRPPARLESLKAKKAQSHSREEFDEKMRLVEERRKLKQDELKTRLRTITVRGRRPAPVSSMEEGADSILSPVESLNLLTISGPSPASALHSQIPHRAAVGGEWVIETGGDNREWQEAKHKGKNSRQGAEEGGECGDCQEGGAEESEMKEEEVTQVEELRADELLAASEELETDSSFQHAEDKDETF